MCSRLKKDGDWDFIHLSAPSRSLAPSSKLHTLQVDSNLEKQTTQKSMYTLEPCFIRAVCVYKTEYHMCVSETYTSKNLLTQVKIYDLS